MRIARTAVIALVAFGVTWGALSLSVAGDRGGSPAAAASGPCGLVSAAPTYKHVIVVVMENHSYSSIIGSASAPYINSLAASCGLATSYQGLTHFSLPNYLGMTSGLSVAAMSAFYNDCLPSSCTSGAPSIFSQTASVRSYEEAMPSNCYRSNSGTYAPKHNPAVYFTTNTACATNDVPLAGGSGGKSSCPATVQNGSHGPPVPMLQTDLNTWGANPPLVVDGDDGPVTTGVVRQYQTAKHLYVDGVVGPQTWGSLGECVITPPSTTGIVADFQLESTAPSFSFVTPDLCDDMHDCSVSTGDSWLKSLIPLLTGSPVYGDGATAIFITWDEGSGGSAGEVCAGSSDPSCHVATIVIAPSTAPGTKSGTAFNHYSLLATAESLLGLPKLGAASTAPTMTANFDL